jgi:putative nucleotidyltransferase with HDIG domain
LIEGIGNYFFSRNIKMNRTANTEGILSTVDKLPPLPHTLVRLLEICNDPETDIQTVGKTVSRDAPLSAKILQLANSAFLGSRTTFTSIEQAVTFLGIDSVRSLAVSVSVQETFQQNKAGPLDLSEFWYHSLLTALIAKNLAEGYGYPHPAEPYLAGLLHDIGKCIFNQFSPEKFKELETDNHPDQLTERENHVFGVSHQEVGAILAARWKLDEKITLAIRQHHSPTVQTEETAVLCSLIFMANLLAHENSEDKTDIFREAKRLSISSKALSAIVEEQKAQVFSIAESMDINIKAPQPLYREIHKKGNPAPGKSGKEQLQKVVRSIALSHGLLESLSRAKTVDRIFTLFEENLQTVFGINKCIILLPDRGTPEKLTIHGSSRNPIAGQMQYGKLSIDTDSDLFKELTENHAVTRLRDLKSKQSQIVIKRLRFIMKEECFPAIPFTLKDGKKGLVLTAVPSRKYSDLISQESSLLLFCTYLGNRLNLEIMKEEHAEELARERAAAKESIARSIAHEISNPLAIIQNYISLLADSHRDRELQKDLQIISIELDRINNISRRLNNLSQAEAPAGLERIDVNRLVSDTVDLFRKSLTSSSAVDLSLSLTPEKTVIFSRPDAIRQILNNLINNAIEATEAKGVIHVETRLGHDNTLKQSPCMKILVTDNGPGISPVVAETLYKPGHTTKNEKHSGLGLAIISKLVADLGGTVNHVSDPKKGTTFTVIIPLHIS